MGVKVWTWGSPLVAAAIAFVAGIAVTAAAFVAVDRTSDDACDGGCASSFEAAPVATATATPTAISTPTSKAAAVDPSVALSADTPPELFGAPAASAPALSASIANPAPVIAPTAVSIVPAPPAPAPPAAAGGPGSPCTTNCGEPRFFCDTWSGGFCDDYRDKYTLQPVGFPGPGDPYTYDVLSTTDPAYTTDQLGGSMNQLRGFTTDQEHFHTAMEDGGFGTAMLRVHQPVDLTSERHIHLDVDMKGRTRNYFRVMLSPELTKRDVDDRSGSPFPNTFIQAWFRNGNIEGSICRNGVCDGNPSYPWGDAFGLLRSWEPVFSPDNVRVPIDIYVSQTSIRIYINGIEKANGSFAPLGFNAAYLYLSQVSYNPCKDGQCAPADQVFHWDNVAFDGPVLGHNSLTPAGSRDVAFNAYGATSCAVRGTPATPVGPAEEFNWVTWVARIPNAGAATTLGEIVCEYTYTKDGSDVVRGVEDVVRR